MIKQSIFTKIIKGEVPSHKVYEDKKTLVFLDVHPAQPGHMLLVPKVQVARLERLEMSDYIALMETLKKAMGRVTEVFGEEMRACIKVEGFDVPHAHIHIIPCRSVDDFWSPQRMDVPVNHEALAAMARKLAF